MTNPLEVRPDVVLLSGEAPGPWYDRALFAPSDLAETPLRGAVASFLARAVDSSARRCQKARPHQ